MSGRYVTDIHLSPEETRLIIHQRRRAQNRASQRAFRDRKEKRMKEINEKLAELQGEHSDLTRSYETLQAEYAMVKQELEALRRTYESVSPEFSSHVASELGTWQCWGAPSDPFLFEISAFCSEDEHEHNGLRGSKG
jgi:AP-1-like factor